ncbi:SDR family NAD(P)-dependent oxidoreductase [Caulobacter sp. X]|uniref:SDR family NAD(P)-dependent oxidoreductase n=1 Tax=Caulobacter sp. X TaxID=2048901 RepID=UPI000C14E50D|nr:SDR family NAD(P)-dependent oxidoreductase [Caulobacter sp. X]PIC00919.1 C-factor [Caulobacter sp. X]
MALDQEPDQRIAVVVGAGGGLGRAFVEELRGEPGWAKVVGVGRRRPTDWPDDPRLPFLVADLLDEQALAELASALAKLGAPGLILIATGLLHEPGLTPEKAMKAVTAASLSRLFEVNAVLPALICKHLTPLLPRHERAVIAALSARVGSIGDNRLGGWHAYRASKAALNMLIRCQAIELSRERPLAICAALHPGTVDTPLSTPFARGARSIATPREAAAKLLKVVHRLEAADSGGFFDYDGAAVPW